MDEDLIKLAGGEQFEPPDPHKKQRAAARKHAYQPFDTMLSVRSPGEWMKLGRQTATQPLFADLWQTGEVAVLFGDKNVGKSVFAVQLAESIATGRNTLLNSDSDPAKRAKPQKVLYLDFQQTPGQFTARYSAPSPMPGKLPLHCRFHFKRAAIEWNGELPAVFKKIDDFVRYSVLDAILDYEARVVIIDDLSYLGISTTAGPGCLRIMKTLKLWAALHDLSILVLTHAKPRNAKTFSLKPITLQHLPSTHIAQQAHSVFTLAPSTYAPEIRYIKHLASARPITHDASNVLTYQLDRFDSPPYARSEVAAASADGVVLSSGTRSDPDCQPPSANCFLGLKHLGPSAESDHLRDYAAEALAAEHAHQAQLKRLRTRSAREAIKIGLLDGAYKRYLLD